MHSSCVWDPHASLTSKGEVGWWPNEAGRPPWLADRVQAPPPLIFHMVSFHWLLMSFQVAQPSTRTQASHGPLL